MSEHVPLVSVIMPVYNTEAYLGEAIRSVLDQHFTDLELIVVDDGSADGSADVISSFTDPRIRFERHTSNRGVSRTLNRALELASGTYIARHDSDDVSLPDRIAKQVAYLQAHPECGIVGTYASTTTPEGEDLSVIEHHPTSDAGIRFAQFFDSAFVSSTVIFKRSLLENTGGFDEDPARPIWDDYDMWSRLVRYTKATNLPEYLLRYRMLGSGLTGTTTHARDMVMEQRRRNIRFAIPAVNERILELSAAIGFQHSRCTKEELQQVLALQYLLIDHCAPSPAERVDMESLARQRAMSFHLTERGTPVSKAVDIAMKAWVVHNNPRSTKP